MSRLAEFRRLEQQLATRLAELETLKNDNGLKQEIEFETKLKALLQEYGYSLREIVTILEPRTSAKKNAAVATPEKSSRKPRSVKTYKNPHNGETLETKGGNHKTLKQWKSEYGGAEVESWLA
ncbi:histone-like nucleoid-structuring protein, MvaT/MvaU family [Pseudomonas sp. SLFW]|uniref:histone-like nucleoid-structuring protein, MvaT/MvaU family n=1 Tax=Pseudomonas sp. SLFW TaxID=2683259 RepID=UPI001412BCE3|nr:histone-like nucleoid-structuring protein, MvaT/MvaU family [Pseudomonas sp. SLFW]NBB11152.1 H-NS histone family protein [Pseudomonas sp. SLFW]